MARARSRTHVALVRRRLRQRLVACAAALSAPTFDEIEDDAEAASRIVLDVLGRAQADPAILWLVWVAISTTFPTSDDVEALLAAAGADPFAAATDAVEAGLHRGERDGDLLLGLIVSPGAVVVDVTFSATNDHNSGIQRVVRSASKWWAQDEAVVLAAAAGRSGALRTLSTEEFDRTARWGSSADGPVPTSTSTPSLVVPWRGAVLFPEVPDPWRAAGLAAMARYSGNRAVAVGYDAIPITGREFVSARETAKFSHFLQLLEQLDLVIGISDTAAADFGGLAAASRARGAAAPSVIAVPLPIMVDRRQPTAPEGEPLVLVVGSKEPRKNHDAIVFAAEVLWREGLRFQLRLVGTYGWSTRRFRMWLRRARRAGRDILAPSTSSDTDIWAAYDRASFTVFPSFQEGFGLPIAESLSRGVPVITTGYGSTAEVAAGGGCLLVDPYSDASIIGAMRDLLTQPETLGRLRAEIAARPSDSWEQYAGAVLAAVRGDA